MSTELLKKEWVNSDVSSRGGMGRNRVVSEQVSVEETIRKQPSERRRVLTASAVGVVLGCITAMVGPWQLALLAGWDLGSTLLVGWIWVSVGMLDADATRLLAIREDDSRAASRAGALRSSGSPSFSIRMSGSRIACDNESCHV